MDFSFNKEKVRKECYKLVGISNLGAKTLNGYMENRGISPYEEGRGFSASEAYFVTKVARALCSSHKDCTRECIDYIFKGGIRPAQAIVFSSQVARASTYNIYELFQFCTEWLEEDMPCWKLEDITRILIDINLPIISLKVKQKLGKTAVAYIFAAVIYQKANCLPATPETILSQKARNKATAILADILHSSPYMEAIMLDVKRSLNCVVS